MLRKLLLLSTVASFAAFPVMAQNATDPAAEPAPLPAPTEPADQATQPPAEQPTTDMTQQPVAPAEPTTEPTAEAEVPATPPPSEAIIPAQAPDEVRADTLIGMTVYDTAGEKVGEVKDIIFNADGQATGVVLSVGGVLGLGAKSVGLNWSELDVQPEAELVKVQYNKDQLKAAPDFKTAEAQKAEADAAQMQLDQQTAPANAPADSGATGTVPPPTPE
jgi:sporulation protein YlmC with PRC-barrel domain